MRSTPLRLLAGGPAVLPAFALAMLLRGSGDESRAQVKHALPPVRTATPALTVANVRPANERLAPRPEAKPAPKAAPVEKDELDVLADEALRYGFALPPRQVLEAGGPRELRKRIGEWLPINEATLVALLDASPMLAGLAAERLAQMAPKRSITTLEAVLVSDRPLEVRLAIARALGKVAGDEERAWLLGALARAGRGDEAAPLALAAVQALGRDAAGPVLALASDPARDPGVRAAVYVAFAGSPAGQTDEVRHALVEALTDPAPEIRKAAIAVVGESLPRRSNAVALLASIVRSDADPEVRVEASAELGSIGDASALPALRHALALEPDSAARESLEESIAALEKDPGNF